MDVDKVFTFKDKFDNSFKCKDGKITMVLNGTSKVLHIGEILIIKGLIIYKKKENETHIHRGTNSWTLPVPLFDKIDGIWYYSKTYNYKILKSEALANKPLLNYRKWKTELKVCIPLQLWMTKPIS